MKNLVLASSGSVYGTGYLEYLLPTLEKLYKNVTEVLFVPYAQPGGISYDNYTIQVQKAFDALRIKVKGIHEFDDRKKAIANAQGIFIGGGNTFLLVSKMYEQDLWDILTFKVESGVPYLGTSAGTNIAGLTMQTTNDMPIVLPPSYKTLGWVPFNFNAHYIAPDKNSTHKGETRATRIKEFQAIENIPVLGLREGSWLRVQGDTIFLRGGLPAVWFEKGNYKEILTF
ncbi:dipeptidase PepE [Ochrovirga pacifica]|uniref:dipeptidase PepE n=1 Tax=Ochrovirga pacifica TaxID=1042376 RepID=UPI00025591E4